MLQGHGWCNNGKQCTKSHAIDLILDLDGSKAAKNRKRRRRQREMQQQEGTEDMTENPDTAVDMRDCSDGQTGNLDNCLAETPADSLETSHDSPDNQQSSTSTDNLDYDIITDAYLKSSFELEQGRSGGHRAGFDAFMTGFIMACFLSKHTTVEDTGKRVVGAGLKLSQLSGVESLRNKIYATGKDHPITVSKSNFCNTSKNHREKIQQLRKA